MSGPELAGLIAWSVVGLYSAAGLVHAWCLRHRIRGYRHHRKIIAATIAVVWPMYWLYRGTRTIR